MKAHYLLITAAFMAFLSGCSKKLELKPIIVSSLTSVENLVVVSAPEPLSDSSELALVSVCRKEDLEKAQKGDPDVLRSAVVLKKDDFITGESVEVTFYGVRNMLAARVQGTLPVGRRLGPIPKRAPVEI